MGFDLKIFLGLVAPMKLRDHPLMTRKSGMQSWPPYWAATTGDQSQWPKGEVGTLQKAWMHGNIPNCVFLFIEHEGEFDTGSVYVDNAPFCRHLCEVCKSMVGHPIKEIGDLDLAYTL